MIEAPIPLVKSPRLIRQGRLPPRVRQGRGFSVGEIREVGLSPKEARLLGIYVDERRKSVYPGNVKALRDYLNEIIAGAEPSEPKLPKEEIVKPKRRRVFRGLTPAGRRMRGLMSLSLRQTHKYKWKRKAKERKLRKRHEASRGARPPFF